MTAKQCIDWLEEIVESIPEIQKTGLMADTSNSYPYAVVRLATHNFSQLSIAPHTTGLAQRFGSGEYTFVVEIHYPLESLIKDRVDVICMVDSFMSAFRSKALGEGIHGVTAPTGSITGLPTYGNIRTYGPEFTIGIKSEDLA